MICIFALSAAAHPGHQPSKSAASQVKSAVDKVIQKRLFYPLSDAAEGAAQVSVEVKPSGQLELLSIETDNPKIKRFIERRLSSVVVRDVNVPGEGEVFHYKIVFRKQ